MKEIEKIKPTGLFTNYIYKAIPLAFDESMSYYETLCGLLNYLKNTVIPTVNNNADAVIELQILMKQLQNYVDNYFENLDVQEEINNKLDKMVENGTLQEIITSYLNSKAIFGFDNISLMKSSTNLINGSYAKTLGYYEKNDGGNGLYKIRNIEQNETTDEMFLISINNNLVAELIINENTNIKTIGAKGNGVQIEDNYFNAMIKKMNTLKVPSGTYLLNNTININNINVDIKGRIEYNGIDYAFLIQNANYKNYNFSTIVAPNGGLIKLSPNTSNNTIIYCNFSINNGSAKKENLLLDGSIASISLNKFICKRLYSSNDNTIVMKIENGNQTWITENEFIGIDIKSTNNKAVYCTCSGTSSEIQYKLTDCDLEDSKGLYFKGNITDVVLLNCRLLEIASHQNWITIEDTLPKISIIGSGILYPKNIELINITSNKSFIYTNLEILVHESGYYYHGGFISKQGILKTDDIYYQPLSITNTELTNDHYYTLVPSYNNNQFNFIALNVDRWVEITIPNYLGYYELIFRSLQAVNVTFQGTNGSTLIENAQGYYKLSLINGKVCYTKLNQ